MAISFVKSACLNDPKEVENLVEKEGLKKLPKEEENSKRNFDEAFAGDVFLMKSSDKPVFASVRWAGGPLFDGKPPHIDFVVRGDREKTFGQCILGCLAFIPAICTGEWQEPGTLAGYSITFDRNWAYGRIVLRSIEDVYYGDLNTDGRLDFLIVIRDHDTGQTSGVLLEQTKS